MADSWGRDACAHRAAGVGIIAASCGPPHPDLERFVLLGVRLWQFQNVYSKDVVYEVLALMPEKLRL